MESLPCSDCALEGEVHTLKGLSSPKYDALLVEVTSLRRQLEEAIRSRDGWAEMAESVGCERDSAREKLAKVVELAENPRTFGAWDCREWNYCLPEEILAAAKGE